MISSMYYAHVLYMIFGTDGIRGIVNSIQITPSNFYRLGQLFAQYISGPILVSQDTRESSMSLAMSFISGALTRADVYHTALPIGSLSRVIFHSNIFMGGVMITASHNPYNFNGIKFFNQYGEKIHFKSNYIMHKEQYGKYCYVNYDIRDIYDSNILNVLSNVLIDCGNGALSYLSLNNMCNNQYNGSNINTYSDIPKHYHGYYVRTDGDGDRIELFYNHEYIAAECIIATLAQSNNCHTIVGTLMSSLALKRFCKTNKIKFYCTDVGDINVYNCIKSLNSDNVIGGEPSGHIIYKHAVSDPLMIIYHYILSAEKIYLKYDYVIEKSITYTDRIQYINYAEIMSKYNMNSNYNVVIRPSGTENKLRIKVETTQLDTTKEIMNEIEQMIGTEKLVL